MTRSRDTADTQDNLGGAVAPFVAGKNKIINGDFGVWQRGTSFNATTLYTADRWDTLTDKTAASVLITQQTFTPGTAPVAGYESQYFLRTVFPSGGSYCIQEQRIENVGTFAGQTVTLSFWAKADATVSIEPAFVQHFGSGGSTNVQTTGSTLTLTTSWVRYSTTVTLPSISGKTIGANNYLTIRAMRAVTASGFTIDIWGVQIEAGSVATPFTTASGSIGGELALCQRYYFRTTATTQYDRFTPYSPAGSSTNLYAANFTLPVQMRAKPTVIDISNLTWYDGLSVGNTVSAVTISSNSTPINAALDITTTGMTQYRPVALMSNTTSGYLGVGAEL